jgi:hypothetical protein
VEQVVASVATSFAADEVAEVLTDHPGLAQTSPGELEGVLQLHHAFGDVTLTDTFSVRITATPQSNVPLLTEIGGRTAAIATQYKLEDVRALHCNPADRTACVAVLQDLSTRFPPGSRLLAYVDDLAMPYLYGLSHFEKYGKWPWGEYSHGALGLLEYYATAPEQTKASYEKIIQTLKSYNDFWPEFKKKLVNPGGQRSCICGSGQHFSKCHYEAWKGIKRLRAAMMRLGLDPARLAK